EAVRAADATVNFAQFDTNGDGVVDHLMVVHAGAGQESSPSNKDLIWSHRWAVLDADPTTPGSQSQTADGVQIYGYTMESEDFVIGTVATSSATIWDCRTSTTRTVRRPGRASGTSCPWAPGMARPRVRAPPT